MAQTDEQRVENPQRLARYQLQRPFQNRVFQSFSSSGHLNLTRVRIIQRSRRGLKPESTLHRGIDVTATCESSKLITPGQLPSATPNGFALSIALSRMAFRHAAPFSKLSKCKSHAHHFAKVEARGASPRESTISCGHRPVAGHGYAKAGTPVQIRLIAPFHVFVADTERHRSRKSDHVGAKPTEGSISNTLHIVTVSIPRCERGGAGATPAVGTISSSCARQRAEPAVCNTALPSASLGRTSTFHRIRESQRTHLVWDQEAPGAAPGYPTIFIGL